jgi:fission process protein 1
MMHEALTEVSPELVMQLAGCAVMVGTGKVMQVKEEEEGIEPAAPWALEGEGEGAEKAVDLYRDTAVRYFGYANEVGEAFRPLVPAPMVTFSYLVAFAYIAADSYSQGAKVVDPSSGGGWKKPSVLASIDSLLFQFMASVIFPSFTINRWVTFLGTALSELPQEQFANVPTEVLQYLPTATGLFLIPLICGPLDVLTHRLLDSSFRSVSETILAKDR